MATSGNSANTSGPPQASPLVNSPDLLRRSTTIPSAGTSSFRWAHRRSARRRKNRTATLNSVQTEPKNSASTGAFEKIVVDVDKALNTVYPPAERLDNEEEDLDYDSLSNYFVPYNEERARVTKDIRRLAAVVEDPEAPLVFNSDQRLGVGNEIGYRTLTALAMSLLMAKTICDVDNDGISLVYAPLGHNSQRFRKLLDRLRQSDQTFKRNTERSDNEASFSQKSRELAKDSCALIDFISESLARFISQIASGDSWRQNQLAALAKFTAKMKFVLEDISQSASVAFRNGETALATFEATYGDVSGSKQAEEMDPDTVFRQFTSTLNTDAGHEGYFRGIEYRVNQQRIRHGFTQALDYVLASLLPGNRHRGFDVTEYEICGVVMETGYHDFQVSITSIQWRHTYLKQENYRHSSFKTGTSNLQAHQTWISLTLRTRPLECWMRLFHTW